MFREWQHKSQFAVSVKYCYFVLSDRVCASWLRVYILFAICNTRQIYIGNKSTKRVSAIGLCSWAYASLCTRAFNWYPSANTQSWGHNLYVGYINCLCVWGKLSGFHPLMISICLAFPLTIFFAHIKHFCVALAHNWRHKHVHIRASYNTWNSYEYVKIKKTCVFANMSLINITVFVH